MSPHEDPETTVIQDGAVPATGSATALSVLPGGRVHVAQLVGDDEERSAAIVTSYLASLQSSRSQSTAEDSFKRIAKVLGLESPRQIPWTRLGYDELQLIRRLLAETGAPATANVTLSAIRGVFRVGYLTQRLSANQWMAAQQVKKVKGSRLGAGRALSQAEIFRLFDACAKSERPRSTMLQAIVATMCGLGLRNEETVELLVDHVAGGEVRILGKGNRERMGYLDAPTRRRLESWLEARKQITVAHRYLFFVLGRKANRPLGKHSLGQILGQLGELAQIDHFTPHDLRRTFSTALLDAGLDLAQVQRLMGHASIETTVRYDKREEKALAERRLGVRIFDE